MSKNTVLKFKKEELDALLKDPDSQVHLQEDVEHHMLLTPVCLSDPHAAILAILNADLMKFFPKFKGILLSYKHVRMLGTTGTIYDDNCHIHINLLVDLYIFTPTVGCILTGIVSKKSPYNIGLLVHKGFNVAIPVPKNEISDDWETSSLQIGQEIKFEVEILNFKGKLPYIRGKLITEDLLTGLKKTKKNKSKKNELEQPISDNEEHSIVPSHSHKRKRKHSEVSHDHTVDAALIKDISSDSGVSSPSSKRKKYKSISYTEQVKKDQIFSSNNLVSEDNDALHNIDSEFYKKKKKKHKKSKDLEDNEERSVSFNNSANISDLDKMQLSSDELKPSRISQTYETTQPPKKKKKKGHLWDIEDQTQEGLSSENSVQCCATSLNNEFNVNDHDDGTLTVNCSLKEKKRKRHKSETKDVALYVKSYKKQKCTEIETG